MKYQYRLSVLHCLSLAQEHFFTIFTVRTYLKRKINSKDPRDPRVNLGRAINKKLLFMKQPVNYRSFNDLGWKHFMFSWEQDKYLPRPVLTYHPDLPLLKLSWLK